jgi:hypothetical protein
LIMQISYFDMETESYLYRKVFSETHSNNPDSDHFWNMQKLEEAYRTLGDAESINLHVSRTLDQSYYTALIDTTQRDHDQVVYRHTLGKAIQKQRRSDDGNSESRKWGPEVDKIRLMVANQLWLWKIGGT